jgi:hypothetical protein
VAKGVTLVAVRVLDCNGSGTWSGVIAGIDWVTADRASGTAAMANMSLGGGANSAVDSAVKKSIADGVSQYGTCVDWFAPRCGHHLGLAQGSNRYHHHQRDLDGHP